MGEKTILIAQDYLKLFYHHFNNSYAVMDNYFQSQSDLPIDIGKSAEEIKKLVSFSQKLIDENFGKNQKISWNEEIKSLFQFLGAPVPDHLKMPKLEVDDPVALRFLIRELVNRAVKLNKKNGPLSFEILNVGTAVQIRVTVDQIAIRPTDFGKWQGALNACLLPAFGGNISEILNDFPRFTMVVNLLRGIRSQNG